MTICAYGYLATLHINLSMYIDEDGCMKWPYGNICYRTLKHYAIELTMQ